MDSYQIHFNSDPKLSEQLNKKIHWFNSSKIGKYDYHPLSITAMDNDDNIIGSIIGQTGLDWLYIEVLWVDERNRKTGIGSDLLVSAEKEAKNRFCRGSYLYTYSFQNPGFYERMGYSKFGELPDFPPGHIKFFMKKHFTE
ncbi:GNAT family N-acetyltransferase [Desulfocicer niacini]